MIYWTCGNCGLEFRKGRLRKKRCIRCGCVKISEDDVPSEDLTMVDDVVDEMILKKYLRS